MDKIKDMMIEKNFLLNEAVEDFKAGRIKFVDFLYKVETVAKGLNKVFDYWDNPLKDYKEKDYGRRLEDLDEKTQKAYIFKKSDTPIITQEKERQWFKESVKNWSQGFKWHLLGTTEPRREELVILPSASRGMDRHNLTMEDIKDAFTYGEARKNDPTLIKRTYMNRQIFVRAVPDQEQKNVCLAVSCWKVG